MKLTELKKQKIETESTNVLDLLGAFGIGYTTATIILLLAEYIVIVYS